MNKYVFYVEEKIVRKIEVYDTDLSRAKDVAVAKFKENKDAEPKKEPVITVLCTYFGPASEKELAGQEKAG